MASIDPNLPQLEQLIAELTQPTYSINTVGKVVIDKVPDGAHRALQPYIRQNLKFFVAKVNLKEHVRTGLSYLRPIQFAFEIRHASPKQVRPLADMQAGVIVGGFDPVDLGGAQEHHASGALDYQAIERPEGVPEGQNMENYVAQIERNLLQSALGQTSGVQVKAAELLGISYRSFRHLMKKYDL